MNYICNDYAKLTAVTISNKPCAAPAVIWFSVGFSPQYLCGIFTRATIALWYTTDLAMGDQLLFFDVVDFLSGVRGSSQHVMVGHDYDQYPVWTTLKFLPVTLLS